MKTCTKCKIEKPLSEFNLRGKSRPGQYRSQCKTCTDAIFQVWYGKQGSHEKKAKNVRQWRNRNRDLVNTRQNAYTARVKAETIAIYGGACVCCGKTELAFLSVDHKFGGGNVERKTLRKGGGKAFYLWLKKNGYPKDKYQVLCHNCNQAKSMFGVCPHELVLSKLLAEKSVQA